MSSDRVMSKYFDISLFDEENYSDVYLGKKFEINAVFGDFNFEVPVKIDRLEEQGWRLADGNEYDKNSLVFAYETIDATITNDLGHIIAIQFYNSSRSSVKLSECYIVKFRIENDFYTNPQGYNEFNKILQIAEQLPKVRFYGYTKSAEVLEQVYDEEGKVRKGLPKNLHINNSLGTSIEGNYIATSFYKLAD